MNATVKEMNHVTLKMQIAGSARPAGAVESATISFIYGLAVDGLNPLETLIAGKQVAEFVEAHVPRREGALFFGHLLPGIRQWWESLPPEGASTIRVTVQDVRPAQNHDIVKAMAHMGSHCGGGSCGCGCG